jgi:hypothetical protein
MHFGPLSPNTAGAKARNGLTKNKSHRTVNREKRALMGVDTTN